MICYIDGTITDINFTYVELDVGGIGYHINIPLLVHSNLPKVGQNVKLFTQAVYREDSQALYGFLKKEERDFFNTLISRVSGVGPKTALNIMSRMSLDVLKQAIADRDLGLLSKCQGLGKKTAEKLIVELSDKIVGTMKTNTITSDKINNIGLKSNVSDAISALVSLGYRANDADKAVKKVIEKIGSDAPTEELLKLALKA